MRTPDRFIAIRFVVRWGRVLPWLAALFCLSAGFAVGCFGTAAGAVAMLVVATLAWGCIRLAIEVVDLVAETLLPR